VLGVESVPVTGVVGVVVVVFFDAAPPPIPANPARPKLLDAPPNGIATRAPYTVPELPPVRVR
jgi:hypothetical protein